MHSLSTKKNPASDEKEVLNDYAKLVLQLKACGLVNQAKEVSISSEDEARDFLKKVMAEFKEGLCSGINNLQRARGVLIWAFREYLGEKAF